jgi:hypothetical protein
MPRPELAPARYLRYLELMAKVLVSFDDGLLRRIDRAAKASGKSRSAYLAELAASGSRGGKAPTARAALRRLDRLFADSPAEDSTAAIRAARDAR